MNKRKVPKIRFKGFYDDWEQRKLSEMCGTFEYGLNAAAKEFDGKNKYIRITDIDDASREFLLSDLSSPDICLDGMSKYILSSGDIVFARTGASVGKTYIYRENDGIVYFAGFLIRAKVNQDNDAEFVFQSTLSPSYEKYIRITSQRSGQPGVNAQEYGEYDLFAPSKEEQQRIGHFLRGIDNLITLHQRKLEKLKIIKKSMLENCFPKNGEKAPKIRFSGFSDDWEQRKLGDIASDMVVGGDIDKDLILAEGQYPVIANALTGDGIVGYYDKEYRVNAPAVTVTGRGDVGHAKARLVNFTPVVRLLSVKSEHDVFFLENAINTLKIVIESTGVPQLTVPQLAKYEVAFPRQLDEEEHIGAFFKHLDNLITLHQSKLEKLKMIKKSMLETMFV